jgi:hypothetical protein
MGSWYDNMKTIRKPDYVTIRRGEKGLEVVFQYHSGNRLVGIGQKVLELEEVCIRTKDLNCFVQQGEKWGDWGGPIKTGDVLSIRRKEK